MREGTAERFSCRKHRVPTRCVPDDLLCVFPKKKRERRALRSRTMNPIGPFVISVVWSRGRRGGPSRTGCRCAAESFPCRDGGMPVEAESPSAGGYPKFPFRSKNALGGIGAVFRDVVFAWNVRRPAPCRRQGCPDALVFRESVPYGVF